MKTIEQYQNEWKNVYLRLIGESEDSEQYTVVEITDRQDIFDVLPKIIPLIESSYKDGFKGVLEIERLKDTTPLVKVVYGDNGEILAASIYRNIENSKKAICGGQNKTQEGKNALKEIIKSDIEPYTNWIWEEVSGPIEHYFKKFNGYPLPNVYAPIVLEKDKEKIEPMEDGFHYKRVIGIPSDDNRPVEKVIFGFKDKEIADKVMSDAEYKIKREAFNMEPMNESGTYPKDLKHATSYVNQLSDLYDEAGFRELTPWMASELNFAIDTFNRYISYDEWVKDTLRNAENLKRLMPEIKPI